MKKFQNKIIVYCDCKEHCHGAKSIKMNLVGRISERKKVNLFQCPECKKITIK